LTDCSRVTGEAEAICVIRKKRRRVLFIIGRVIYVPRRPMPLRQEKRKSPRVPVSMKVAGEGGETIGFGYAINLSEEGLAVEASALAEGEEIPPVGSEIRIRFKLPKSDLVIALLARLVRVERNDTIPRIGISFVDLTPEIRTEIRRFVLRENRV
jgi:hypothetical protein